MNIRHHIGDETLMAYVNGSLVETISVVVATHLAICPSCRSNVSLMEEVAGLYLVETEPAIAGEIKNIVVPDLKTLGKQETVSHGRRKTSQNGGKDVPQPLADYLPVSLDAVPWKKLVPGISHYPLKQNGPEKTGGALRLLKIAPGKTMPEHSHTGQELTMILKGSYIDDLGRFQEGDIADLDDETWHQPVADTDQDCICLIATDAPLKFSGFFSRLLQPVIGI
jgi:putative transcriptional regulator